MSDINVEQTQAVAEEKATQLPVPKGFKLLCMVPKVEEQFSGGLIKSDDTKRVEEQTTTVLFVAAMGDMAYRDETRFPTGPWCEVGDFILVRPYSGTRIKIHGTEWRIINDDSVEGTVQDPRGIGRA